MFFSVNDGGDINNYLLYLSILWYLKLLLMGVRNILSLQVTRNITLLSTEENRGKIANFKVEVSKNKPLVTIISWLFANKKHVLKYAEFYLARGYDVLTVSVSLWQLSWPAIGSQQIATNILKFLECNTSYHSILIHGISVGGYLWSEVLLLIQSDINRYQNIVDKIRGQIWDSLPHFDDLVVGFPIATFPRNRLLQFVLRQGTKFYMNTFEKCVTYRYEKAFQALYTNIVKAPALFFISKSDPIGTEKSNLRVRENWKKQGIQVYWKCWDKSPHVGHFRLYPEEYKAELVKFMEIIGFGSEKKESSKVKSKL